MLTQNHDLASIVEKSPLILDRTLYQLRLWHHLWHHESAGARYA